MSDYNKIKKPLYYSDLSNNNKPSLIAGYGPYTSETAGIKAVTAMYETVPEGFTFAYKDSSTSFLVEKWYTNGQWVNKTGSSSGSITYNTTKIEAINLSINPPIIILDDNTDIDSDDDTIIIQDSTVTLIYNNETISPTKLSIEDTTISDGNTIITAHYNQDTGKISYSKNSESTDDFLLEKTYTFNFNVSIDKTVFNSSTITESVTTTLVQQVSVKDFSNGEIYELIASPDQINITKNPSASVSFSLYKTKDKTRSIVDISNYSLFIDSNQITSPYVLTSSNSFTAKATINNIDVAYKTITIVEDGTSPSTEEIVQDLTNNIKLTGLLTFKGEWVSGNTYRTNYTSGNGVWTDYVTKTTSTLNNTTNEINTTIEQYSCAVDNSDTVFDTTKWTKLGSTETLIAGVIDVDQLSAKELYLKDTSDNIRGGASGTLNTNQKIEDKVVFWAGSYYSPDSTASQISVEDAPFKVLGNGDIYAKSFNGFGNFKEAPVIITDDNFTDYFYEGNTGYWLDLYHAPTSMIFNLSTQYDNTTFNFNHYEEIVVHFNSTKLSMPIQFKDTASLNSKNLNIIFNPTSNFNSYNINGISKYNSTSSDWESYSYNNYQFVGLQLQLKLDSTNNNIITAFQNLFGYYQNFNNEYTLKLHEANTDGNYIVYNQSFDFGDNTLGIPYPVETYSIYLNIPNNLSYGTHYYEYDTYYNSSGNLIKDTKCTYKISILNTLGTVLETYTEGVDFSIRDYASPYQLYIKPKLGGSGYIQISVIKPANPETNGVLWQGMDEVDFEEAVSITCDLTIS